MLHVSCLSEWSENKSTVNTSRFIDFIHKVHKNPIARGINTHCIILDIIRHKCILSCTIHAILLFVQKTRSLLLPYHTKSIATWMLMTAPPVVMSASAPNSLISQVLSAKSVNALQFQSGRRERQWPPHSTGVLEVELTVKATI